jgi:hypothetical protein
MINILLWRKMHLLSKTSTSLLVINTIMKKDAKKSVINESKKKTFLDTPEWTSIVQNIKGIMTSDATMSTLLDFERVMDEADVFAFKNWNLGELVDGPVISRYAVSATFMWPGKLMPDPRAGKRLAILGCQVKFKKTDVKVPIQVKEPDDFKPGTHYPRLIDREVWLVNVTIPKQLMNDIREGSVDIADQTIDLDDLDAAYEKDYDTAGVKEEGGKTPADGADASGGMPALPGLGA